MIFTNTLSQVFPDQCVFSGPFYTHPQFQQFFRIGQASESNQGHLNSQNLQNNQNYQNVYYHLHSNLPRQVKLVVLQNQDKVENLVISNSGSFVINPIGKGRISSSGNTDTQLSDCHSDSESNSHSTHSPLPKAKFTVTKNIFSNELLTEFNNHTKLKKINSSYHIKRKISTKLQNDLKDAINSLIFQINTQLNLKLPLMTHNSKEFRENVKNEFLKIYGNQTVAKYVCEEVLVERKTPTSTGLEANKKLMKRIEDLYLTESKCSPLKKLITLLHETTVKDFYLEFVNSSRYKKCMDKDLAKYSQKLKKVQHFDEEKQKMFTEIYSIKYDGIARAYFE